MLALVGFRFIMEQSGKITYVLTDTLIRLSTSTLLVSLVLVLHVLYVVMYTKPAYRLSRLVKLTFSLPNSV